MNECMIVKNIGIGGETNTANNFINYFLLINYFFLFCLFAAHND